MRSPWESCVDGKPLATVATLPLLLGAHQIIEAFVWLGLQGHVPHDVERVALWAYLLIAFVVLPVFVPLAVVINEPSRRRQFIMAPLVALGLAVSTILFVAMLEGPITVKLRSYHLAYSIDLNHGALVVVLYVAIRMIWDGSHQVAAHLA